MVIDFHTHAFPDRLSQRAMQNLSFASGGMEPYTDGTVDGLRSKMKENGVDISVVLNIATNPHQMHDVNDFALSVCSSDIIGFGSVHPDAPDCLEELERIKSMGLKGVKFHPDYQRFCIDDKKMLPVYKKISELQLISVFHAGVDFGFAPPYNCTPNKALFLLDKLTSPVVLAHWGGVGYGEEVLTKLVGTPFYFDLSFGYGVVSRGVCLQILEKHDTNRLLFGSDMPWHTPTMEMKLLSTLSLSAEEKEKIFYKNALGLLNL